MPLRSNLRVQLLLLLLVMPVVVVVVALRQATHRRHEAMEAVLTEVEELAQVLSHQHEPIVESARQLLSVLALLPEIHMTGGDTCDALLAGVLPTFPQWANLGVVELDGSVSCSALPFDPSVNLADRAYFRDAVRQKGFAVGSYQVGRITGRPTLNFGYPVVGPDGNVVSVVFGALDLGWLSETMQHAHLSRDAQLLLTDTEGTVLVVWPPEPAWVGAPASSLPLFGDVWAREAQVVREEGDDGVERLLARHALEGIGVEDALYLVVAMPADAAFAEARDAFARDLGVLAGLLLAGVALVSLADLFLLRRLDAIDRAAHRLAQGDLEARTGLADRADPVGALAHTFDEMAESVKRQAERMAHEARHDPLTGLPNRMGLARALKEALTKAEGREVAVLLVIVERLHEVVNTLGYPTGDDLLRQAGPRMRGVLGDVPIGRVGGGEFAAVIEGMDETTLLATGRRVQEAMNQPFVLEGVEIEPGGSVGIARAPRDGSDPERLLQRAGVAAIVARRGGRDVVAYAPEIDPYSPRRLRIIGAIRRGVAGNEMRLLFQPKVDLKTGRAEGAEALVRWEHPELGQVSPVEFIGLAEQTGVIRPLTAWVVREAMVRARALWEAGLRVRVSANVSARDLTDPAFASRVADMMAETGVSPAAIELEVTESALMADPRQARDILCALRDIGVSLAVDDFGTGYSSLAYLRDLPFHVIKIDKAFIRGGPGPLHDPAIVRSVVELGHNLGVTVLAEGVDTSAAAVALKELACDGAQGDYFGVPMDPAVFEAWLRDSPWAAEGALAH